MNYQIRDRDGDTMMVDADTGLAVVPGDYQIRDVDGDDETRDIKAEDDLDEYRPGGESGLQVVEDVPHRVGHSTRTMLTIHEKTRIPNPIKRPANSLPVDLVVGPRINNTFLPLVRNHEIERSSIFLLSTVKPAQVSSRAPS